jgi:uncharacterized membrane protein YeaQ/YmgE (transglycosylase-associated protein family)
MSWILAILVGALVGWLASLVMGTDQQQGALANIAIGILGALLGRLLFVDILGIGAAATAGTLSLAGIFWGVVGAVILIAILKSVRVLR